MFATASEPEAAEGDTLSGSALLVQLRQAQADEYAAAARVLRLAAQWADLHPPESVDHVASFVASGVDHAEPIAGEGAPLVAEFCVAELGAVLGLSTTTAKKLIGHALELRHRLPRLWAAVQTGSVPAWRARSVAEVTIHTEPALTHEAAAYVDSQVAAVAGRIGPAQLDRLVAETIKRFDLAQPDPAADPVDGYLHVDPRHASLSGGEVHFAGTMHFEADLDIADALDLDHALTHGAAQLKALGSEASLDVRRSLALGELARTQTALELAGPGADRERLPVARELVLHAHFDAEATTSGVVLDEIGRLEERQRLVLLDQVRDWCGDSRTKVTIKPVIDLSVDLSTEAYGVPDRMRDLVMLRDRTCVFPWCTRPARASDIDHIVPFDHHAATEGREQPGPTATSNLAALCRTHHRLKTHSTWRYEQVDNGVFEWRSPHGHLFRRDATGTRPIDEPASSGPPGRH